MPPAGDRGQRYEVRFLDEDDVERVLGWSPTYPSNYIDAINAHPEWHTPVVIDRSRSDCGRMFGLTVCKQPKGHDGPHLFEEDFL